MQAAPGRRLCGLRDGVVTSLQVTEKRLPIVDKIYRLTPDVLDQKCVNLFEKGQFVTGIEGFRRDRRCGDVNTNPDIGENIPWETFLTLSSIFSMTSLARRKHHWSLVEHRLYLSGKLKLSSPTFPSRCRSIYLI